MGGGPSSEQRAAAAAQANLANSQAATSDKMLQLWQNQYNKINPYATKIMNNGLPFFNAMTDYSNGISARNNAGARAQILRSIGGANNPALPSGFAAQLLADNSAGNARSFDANMINALMANYNAKNQAAAMLTGQQAQTNPLGWSQAAGSSNNSIMQAPLQTPSVFGTIGGMVTGLGSQAMKVWG